MRALLLLSLILAVMTVCSAYHRKLVVEGNSGPLTDAGIGIGEREDTKSALRYTGSNADNHHSIPRPQYGGRNGNGGQQTPGGDDQSSGGSGGGGTN
ncbi:unnamed protein product [Spirodela intermedia]|uniref:Uncharacterized protein n=2 Tax=Spirodela intermedia TaxID=51605 RepID=A0A7I8K3R8_SPIIN|nr:unnamed protein product [Spirodela intermedia]CAA6655509.1 unnamed protein product [Spirodela intermedia]CAA7390797.1 unnamed protein product [Spirodela intermedia]